GPVMLGRKQYAEGFVVHWLGEDIDFFERQGDDDYIKLAIAQLVAQHVSKIFLDIQRHFRRALVQQRDQLGEQVGTNGVDGADPQGSGQLVFAGLGQFADGLCLLQYPPGLGYYAFTDRGYPHGALAALEQQHTKLLFQFFYANRERRLAHMTPFGSTSKMLLLGQGNNIAQLGKSHSRIPWKKQKI